MRVWSLLLLVPLLSGCLSDEGALGTRSLDAACPLEGPVTWYFSEEFALLPELPAAGEVAGNGFEEAFLSDEMDEWLAPARGFAYLIEGNVTVTYWSRGHDMVAPVVIGGDPGEGYHWFNQVGTSRGFVESYVVEYAPVRDEPTVTRHEHTFVMPDGGLLVEPGDAFRLLLTNLVLDEPAGGRGPDILFGGETPSRVEWTARCVDTPAWTPVDEQVVPVSVPAHHGLLTGAVPATEGVNFAEVDFDLMLRTDRLTISLTQNASTNPTKGDMDLSVRDADGNEVWSIGSPYVDEVGTKWLHLERDLAPGPYTVRVNSYSGIDYEGEVRIRQDALSDAPDSPAA